jgi:cytosine/adenosine deaminase-related metal-dependent hydrolase
MSSQRLLIRNGFVVSMNPDAGEIPNGDVLVEDGVIVEVGRGLEASGADTSNVDSVFVAGRAVKRGGQLVDVDLSGVFRKLDESRNHILSGGGLLPEWATAPMAAV